MRKLKYIGLTLIVLSVFPVFIIAIIRCVNYYKYNISRDTGISESGFVDINGCRIFTQIRGQKADNPVIVFIHGGPGFPLTYLSPYYQQYLEDNFTFVNYEQRVSGRTFYENRNKKVSIDLLINDLNGVIKHVLKKYNKNSVILMGQSWGTLLGTIYIQKYPEYVDAYIGVGQVIDFDKGKIITAQQAIQAAKSKNDNKIVQTLKCAIDEFKSSTTMDDVNIKNLETLIINTGRYCKGDNEISGIKQMYLGLTSPYMNFTDIRWFLNASNTAKIIGLEKELINYMYFDFDIYNIKLEYATPIYFIQGENDYITPTSMVEEYFNSINAPDKDIFKIEGAGHVPFLDSPYEFSKIVKNILLEQSELNH